jgi:hypothetical protein
LVFDLIAYAAGEVPRLRALQGLTNNGLALRRDQGHRSGRRAGPWAAVAIWLRYRVGSSFVGVGVGSHPVPGPSPCPVPGLRSEGPCHPLSISYAISPLAQSEGRNSIVAASWPECVAMIKWYVNECWPGRSLGEVFAQVVEAARAGSDRTPAPRPRPATDTCARQPGISTRKPYARPPRGRCNA